MSKTCDLHLHSKDLFDSDNAAERVCRREAELGACAVALTQHGVASQVESFKKAAKKHGLKFIPGIEAYYRKGEEKKGYDHLIILAKSDEGWKALCRAISATQDDAGLAVMTESDLWQYFGPGSEGHGHVIATTACISGIVADVLLTNEKIDREVRKKLKRSGISRVPEETVKEVEKKVEEAEKAYEDAVNRYTEAKTLAGKRFGKEERRIKTLAGEEKRAAEEALLKEKERAEEAAKAKESLREEVARTKKDHAVKRKELQKLIFDSTRYNEIVGMEKEKRPDSEIMQKAEEAMDNLRTIFGKEDFYAEVQYHGIDTERYVYPRIAAVARKLGVPIVATNDVHIVDNTEEELLRRRILRTLRYETWSEDNAGDDQLFIKTDEELAEWIGKILPRDVVEEAMGNIMAIVDKCNVEFRVTEHYPKYRDESGRTSEEVFDDMIREGVEKLFPEGLPEGYGKRIEDETRVIKQMNYVDYHLVVRDFTDYASKYDAIPFDEIDHAPIDPEDLGKWAEEKGYVKKIGMSNGTGRGSAVGSLDCDLLHITNLDPIKYGLYFERFLNPERVSMPDIDSGATCCCVKSAA